MKKLLSLATMAIFAISFSAFKTASTAVETNGLPDLCIENVEVKCKAQRWLVFEVKNAGLEKSEATLLRIRPIDGDDATQKCIQQAVTNVPQLLPGKVFKLRVPLKEAPNCDCTTAMRFELVIDHKNYIPEANESNNTFLLEI